MDLASAILFCTTLYLDILWCKASMYHEELFLVYRLLHIFPHTTFSVDFSFNKQLNLNTKYFLPVVNTLKLKYTIFENKTLSSRCLILSQGYRYHNQIFYERYWQYDMLFFWFFLVESGIIKSPGFPQSYPDNVDETLLIEVQAGKRISLKFNYFEIEYHYNCV